MFPPDDDLYDDFGSDDYRVKVIPRRPDLKTFWSAFGLNHMIEPGKAQHICNTPDLLFRGEWFIVTTPGFFIEELKCAGRTKLYNVDADIYYRANWDKLERLGQLERVRLDTGALTPANKISLVLRHRGTKPMEFRCAFIGKYVESY